MNLNTIHNYIEHVKDFSYNAVHRNSMRVNGVYFIKSDISMLEQSGIWVFKKEKFFYHPG